MTAAGNGNESASETDFSSAGRDPAGRSKNQPGAIKTMFRNAVKAVTRRDDDEPPPPRRRRGDTDTEKAFTISAKAVLRRTFRIPEEAYAAATDFLFDTLDCMNPWPNDIDNLTILTLNTITRITIFRHCTFRNSVIYGRS